MQGKERAVEQDYTCPGGMLTIIVYAKKLNTQQRGKPSDEKVFIGTHRPVGDSGWLWQG
jgi:hypothetical protein